MTVDELVSQLEDEKKAAERRVSDSEVAVKRVLARPEAEGRQNLTLDEENRLQELMENARKAKDEVSRLSGKLEGARAVAREEDQRQADQSRTHPTGAAPFGGGGELRVGSTRVTSGAWASDVAGRIEQARAHERAFVAGTVDTSSPLSRISGMPEVPTRLYDLLDVHTVPESIGPQPVNTTSYLRQTVKTHNAEFVADSTQKPTSVYSLDEVEDRLRVLAHLSEPIPMRFLDDSTQLQRFLEDEMRAGLLNRLDQAILTGDDATVGTDEFDGLVKLAGTAVAWDTDVPTTTAGALSGQLDAGESPTHWVFSTADWQDLSLTREQTNGQYLFGTPASGPGRQLHGLPVILSPNMPSGTALLVDRRQADLAAKGARLDWNGSDASLFDYNLVKARCEWRVVLRVFRPSAFKAVATVSGV